MTPWKPPFVTPWVRSTFVRVAYLMILSLADFTFHIQNFTTATFSKAVKPGQQSTVGYSFVPADAFAGRPIGLTINLNYRDAAGNFFIDPVFNETVQIVEFDEGFDTETFFMYVCIAGAVVLLLFLGFNFLSGRFNYLKRFISTF